MSRLERPLLAKAIPLTGDIALCAEVTLRIKTNSESWEPVNFLVDPGTEMTTLPAARGNILGSLFLKSPSRGLELPARARTSGQASSGLAWMGWTRPSMSFRATSPATPMRSSTRINHRGFRGASWA